MKKIYVTLLILIIFVAGCTEGCSDFDREQDERMTKESQTKLAQNAEKTEVAFVATNDLPTRTPSPTPTITPTPEATALPCFELKISDGISSDEENCIIPSSRNNLDLYEVAKVYPFSENVPQGSSHEGGVKLKMPYPSDELMFKNTFSDTQPSVYIETNIKLVGEGQHDDYDYVYEYLVCYTDDPNLNYTFMVDTRGYWHIYKTVPGEEYGVTLASGTNEQEIASGFRTNNIKANCNGGELTLIINDNIVGTVIDTDNPITEFSGRGIGIGTDYENVNLKVEIYSEYSPN